MKSFKHLIICGLILGSAGVALAAEVKPFNGRDLSGWKLKGPEARSHWVVGKAQLDAADKKKLTTASGAELVNVKDQGVDIFTEQKFGDAQIELEVMVPQGSNSGIYVMGEYEIQVFDSYGKEKLGGGDMGAIYGAAPPSVNASKSPGDWQQFLIRFKAPRFDSAGNKTENAKFLSVKLNGKLLHENVEMKGPTPSGVTGKETAAGPLMFQGDHGAVAYRNIRVTPLD